MSPPGPDRRGLPTPTQPAAMGPPGACPPISRHTYFHERGAAGGHNTYRYARIQIRGPRWAGQPRFHHLRFHFPRFVGGIREGMGS